MILYHVDERSFEEDLIWWELSHSIQETFIQECEILREELQEHQLKIEGKFVLKLTEILDSINSWVENHEYVSKVDIYYQKDP